MLVDEMVTITKKEYDQLLKSDRMLSHLESMGVDNWDGYCSPPDIINIIVNGKEIEWEDTDDTQDISYRDVMALAGFKNRQYYTVTYSNADDNPSSGELTENSEPVIIKNGTIFNVVDTSKA